MAWYLTYNEIFFLPFDWTIETYVKLCLTLFLMIYHFSTFFNRDFSVKQKSETLWKWGIFFKGQKIPQYFTISSGYFAIWLKLISKKSTPDDPPYWVWHQGPRAAVTSACSDLLRKLPGRCMLYGYNEIFFLPFDWTIETYVKLVLKPSYISCSSALWLFVHFLVM